MELARRVAETYPPGLTGYLAFQCALMQRFMNRGGTAEEFCCRLAPVFHRKYAPLFLDSASPVPPEVPIGAAFASPTP